MSRLSFREQWEAPLESLRSVFYDTYRYSILPVPNFVPTSYAMQTKVRSLHKSWLVDLLSYDSRAFSSLALTHLQMKEGCEKALRFSDSLLTSEM